IHTHTHTHTHKHTLTLTLTLTHTHTHMNTMHTHAHTPPHTHTHTPTHTHTHTLLCWGSDVNLQQEVRSPPEVVGVLSPHVLSSNITAVLQRPKLTVDNVFDGGWRPWLMGIGCLCVSAWVFMCVSLCVGMWVCVCVCMRACV